MVRVRSKQPRATAQVASNRTATALRKRKLDGDSSSNGQQFSSGDAVSSRASKRTRVTHLPYQSPASVNAMLSAVTGRKSTKIDETPKRKVKPVRVTDAPAKPLKRLANAATAKSVNPSVRRQLLKTPDNFKKKTLKKGTRSASNKKQKQVKKVSARKSDKILKKVKARATQPKISVPPSPAPAKKRKAAKKVQDSIADDNVPLKGGKRSKLTEVKKKKGKLQPKPHLTCYEKDPTFESKVELPFISTISHSRLLIRAVILNDMKLLKKLIYDEPEKIYTLGMHRSLRNTQNVLDYVIQHENREAYKILYSSIQPKVVQKFGDCPTPMLSQEGSGRGSHMMFGHAMRQVSVGRGGKEGNNAFLYDTGNAYNLATCIDFDGLLKLALEKGVSPGFIDFLMEQLKKQFWDYYHIHRPLRKGHYELVGKGIAKANQKGGYGFNFLHEEALTKKAGSALTPFKPVSVTKKCTYDPRFTPLHCAAINPNVDVLATLLRAMPDFNLADASGWTVGHYAAVCCSPEPLKYLLQYGISTHAVSSTKRSGDGYTLLHAAVSAGRTHNVQVILEHEEKNVLNGLRDDEADEENNKPRKKAAGLLQNDIKYKMTTKGQNALQMACELGHLEIVKLLVQAGTDANRPTPAKYDRVTPLMIAAMFGHLDVVKALVEAEVKVDVKDKRGRTAAHHATMNGHTHVLSYLLRLGVNHLAVDSSGNTLLLYACAYGWYFATMLLLEAGCPPNVSNQWKMTPMAIAFTKGHTGLVTELMKKEGVNVNDRIDDNGRTLFLETCNAGVDIKRLKFLVDDLNADPTCEDFKGSNALHYMAIKQFPDYRDDYKQSLKSMDSCIAYLIKIGCDPLKRNLDESSPVLAAAQSKNFQFIAKLLSLGIQIPFEKDLSGNTLLHHMSNHFTDINSIVHEIFVKMSDDQSNVPALIEMAGTFNKEGHTPLLQLLSKRFSIPNEEYKAKMSKLIETFLEKLNVDINAKTKNKSLQTALHLAIESDILEVVLKYKPLLDPVDENSQTPLHAAVMDGHQDAAEKLIEAGANVNFKSKTEYGIGLALLSSMKQTKSFYLIPKLIAKGANVNEIHPKTKNSILHYIARKPTLLHAAEALKAVLDAGVSPNLKNCDGRTALHLAMNARGSETDVFYDIEDVLITSGADLTIKDHRGRIPLHYAFVKIGSPTDATFFDPIELVSHIVTAMKSSFGRGQIHCADVYGSTALHYSAFRGATICSSYLIQTLKAGEIDTSDNNGNTAFGLAVRNAHEGCALNFYQKDANFLRTINNNIKIQDLRTEEATISGNYPNQNTSTQEPWKFTHVLQEDEEKELLREEEERYPILEQVVKHDWQGLLYLMIGQLQSSGVGFSTGISTALKTKRLKLALKLALKVKQKKELAIESGTLFHTLAKYFDGRDEELVMKICETFRKNGLDPFAVDEFASQAVIYALANHQHKLCEMILPSSTDLLKTLSLMKPDLFGRTPFSALFWKLTQPIPHNVPLQHFAQQLITSGINPNQLCEYPFVLTPYPGVRCRNKLINVIPSHSTRYTPLIAAVIARCYLTVKWLLNLKSEEANEVNINSQDSEGLTALMHAIRLNDTRMVKLLLDPVNYDYAKDVEGKILPKLRSSKIDVTIKDKKGYTVMDHLILSPGNNCYYKNVKQIVDMLQSMKAVGVTSGDGLSPVDRAIKHKRSDIVQLLSKHVPLPANKKALLTWQNLSDFPANFSQDILLSPVTDFSAIAEKMAEQLLEKEKQKRRERGEDDTLKPLPDPLCGLDKDNSELILDTQQNIPYDCLMTKVDLNYGIYGLYNFYKMQLVKQPRGKELILLFTQWGRVGSEGQFQKTPFATEEEAIKEFTKIFRSKSGNAWEDVQNFNPNPTKYRLVKKDLRVMKHSTEARVDFDELEKAARNHKSPLPRSITSLMKNLSLFHKDAGSNYGSRNRYFRHNQTQANYDSLPFLPLDVLVKADGLLKKIADGIKKKQEMDGDGSGKFTEKDKLDVVTDIVKLSEEFYSIIPVFGYSTEKLEPIFQDDDLRQKLIDISRLLHLEVAKSLLLSAQYHQLTTNPFEYIYRCLGTKIQLLDRTSSMDKEVADVILQYIHNTGEYNVKVQGIYRVDIPSENVRLNATNIQNRQLLWHGTSSANMLSILQQGLQVAPLSAQISGALFGKGVYLADMFKKSQHYCHSGDRNGQKRKYMLLCEAALGKIWDVKLDDASENSMPAGYDSLKTADSRYEPDPESTVLWKGRTVSLGKQKEKYYKDDWGWGLDYNEYIVFNVDQVAVRYLIEFEE